MSRRFTAGASDNLELLLDTMCNAFGGVIFIAILLAVLAQFAEFKEAAEPDLAEASRLQRELIDLEEELRALRATREQQLRDVEALESVLPLIDELRTVRQTNVELRRELESLARQAEEACQRAAAAGDVSEWERRRWLLGQQEAALEQAITEAQRGEVRRGVLPRLVASEKDTFYMIVKWNRLFVLKKPTARTPFGAVNETDVTHARIRSDDGTERTLYDAIPDRGVRIDAPGWERAPIVADIVRYVPPEDCSLHFAVYPDSYPSLLTVREFFLDKGYDYRWHVIPAQDLKLPLTPSLTAPDVLR